MIHFSPSQWAGPGFCMNCDITPTMYAASGHEMTTGHSTLPIAWIYGTPRTLATWLADNRHWSTENCTPSSMGIDTGFAWAIPNFSTIPSMYACWLIASVLASRSLLISNPRNHFIGLWSVISQNLLILALNHWASSACFEVRAMSSVATAMIMCSSPLQR